VRHVAHVRIAVDAGRCGSGDCEELLATRRFRWRCGTRLRITNRLGVFAGSASSSSGVFPAPPRSRAVPESCYLKRTGTAVWYLILWNSVGP